MLWRFLTIAAVGLGMVTAAHADPYQDGIAAAYRGDYSGAFKLWQPLAAAGMAEAQNNVGSLYAGGLGVKQDPAAAVKWYQAAADQGLAEAENNLGYAFEKGLGVSKDVVQAATWYQRAADQGNALGQLNIGLFYENGVGVPMDPVAAFMWLGLANAQGQQVARAAMSGLIATMTADQITQGLSRERSWKPPVAPTN
jgi:TPR repeat protein